MSRLPSHRSAFHAYHHRYPSPRGAYAVLPTHNEKDALASGSHSPLRSPTNLVPRLPRHRALFLLLISCASIVWLVHGGRIIDQFPLWLPKSSSTASAGSRPPHALNWIRPHPSGDPLWSTYDL